MTLNRATPQEHLEYWLNSAATTKDKDVALRRLAKRESRYWAKRVRSEARPAPVSGSV